MCKFASVVVAMMASVVCNGARGEEWMPQKEVNQAHARVRGKVEYREETRAGKAFVVITVSVETKAQGFGQTARGTAVYTVFNADGSVYKTIAASKYASTGIHEKSKTKSNSAEIRVLKDSFFEHMDSDALVVIPKEKGLPGNPSEIPNWVKGVFGPELDKVRLQIMQEAAGVIKEGPGWIIRKRK